MKKIIAAAATLGAAVPLLLAGNAQAASPADPVITKVQYNAPGSPDGAWNRNAEYIRLTNRGGTALNLQGWKVRDNAGNTYTFPTKWLQPGGYVNVRTGPGVATYTDRYWGRAGHVWNNTGFESARLISKWGTQRDYCGWYGNATGFVWC